MQHRILLHSAFNGDQIFLFYPRHLTYLGDKQAQDAVLELSVDVLLLDLVPHIEAAAAGADEALPAQIPRLVCGYAHSIALGISAVNKRVLIYCL